MLTGTAGGSNETPKLSVAGHHLRVCPFTGLPAPNLPPNLSTLNKRLSTVLPLETIEIRIPV